MSEKEGGRRREKEEVMMGEGWREKRKEEGRLEWSVAD
jgi:hypothetical protein